MQSEDSTAEAQAVIDALITELVRSMKDLGVPTSIHQDLLDFQAQNDDDKDRVGFSRKDYGGHLADPNIMLWGATHERTVPVIGTYPRGATLLPVCNTFATTAKTYPSSEKPCMSEKSPLTFKHR